MDDVFIYETYMFEATGWAFVCAYTSGGFDSLVIVAKVVKVYRR